MPQSVDSSAWTGLQKERIGIATAIAMVGTALVLDGLQALLFFLNVLPAIGQVLDVVGSWFISFLAVIIFGLWFALCRVNYFTGKKAGMKLLIMLSTVVVELIPILDAIPAITFGVVALIIQTRIEDKGLAGADAVTKAAQAAPVLRAAARLSRGMSRARRGATATVPAGSASRAHAAGTALPPGESYGERRARFQADRDKRSQNATNPA